MSNNDRVCRTMIRQRLIITRHFPAFQPLIYFLNETTEGRISRHRLWVRRRSRKPRLLHFICRKLFISRNPSSIAVLTLIFAYFCVVLEHDRTHSSTFHVSSISISISILIIVVVDTALFAIAIVESLFPPSPSPSPLLICFVYPFNASIVPLVCHWFCIGLHHYKCGFAILLSSRSTLATPCSDFRALLRLELVHRLNRGTISGTCTSICSKVFTIGISGHHCLQSDIGMEQCEASR